MTGEGPLLARWHRLRAAYRFCNLATHHALGFTVKLALLLYFAFTILFLALRYAVLPNIDHYKGDIERAASRAAGNQVTISRIYASWSGLRPSLRILPHRTANTAPVSPSLRRFYACRPAPTY